MFNIRVSAPKKQQNSEQERVEWDFSSIGGLVLVPRANVTPQPDLSVDDLLRIYVTLGALAPDARGAFAGRETFARSIAPDPAADNFEENL